jgi:hypothetical protein
LFDFGSKIIFARQGEKEEETLKPLSSWEGDKNFLALSVTR